MNLKSLRRLPSEDHLQISKRGGRKRSLGTRRPMAVPQAAGDICSQEFISDALTDGRRLRVPVVIGDFTRKCPALVTNTSLTGMKVVRGLDLVIVRRECPGTIGSDNGPKSTSTAILSWCQQTEIASRKIASGKPMQMGSSSASTATFETTSRASRLLPDLKDTRVWVTVWKEDYTHPRPHSALGSIKPAKFVRKITLKMVAA